MPFPYRDADHARLHLGTQGPRQPKCQKFEKISLLLEEAVQATRSGISTPTRFLRCPEVLALGKSLKGPFRVMLTLYLGSAKEESRLARADAFSPLR